MTEGTMADLFGAAILLFLTSCRAFRIVSYVKNHVTIEIVRGTAKAAPRKTFRYETLVERMMARHQRIG